MDLADIVRQHAPAYLRKYGTRMPIAHRKAIDAILRCHTPACGGSLYACDGCGRQRFAYHRCGHRACNQCGHPQQETWLAAQLERLLPVGYFLVTFTIPKELRPIFRAHQRLCYDALFAESAGALQDVAGHERYLGGELGCLGVLHTWSRQLVYHPHVHYLVPAVALRADGTLCFPKDPEYLLPVQRLGARFRSRLRRRLREADPALIARVPARTWRKPWVVHSQSAGRGPEALSYLARYVQKTAISGTRLLDQDAQRVTFSYRESGTNIERTLALSGEHFLQRFLQHVLPKGFRRVRSYGWLSPAAKRRLEEVRTLLDAPVASVVARVIRPAAAVSVCCPQCSGPMRRIADFGRAPPPPVTSDEQ